ncbi:MAG: hypothetical protein PHV20_08020 [Bacteroidales bacterium]|nr:hypothetical protein [Bacteroidales bacterium]
MEVEKGKTAKYLRDKQGVSEQVKENLKAFTQIKKRILDALKESDMTILQLSQKLEMPTHEVMYNLLSMVKFGWVETGEIDDMDEYYTYKLKQ